MKTQFEKGLKDKLEAFEPQASVSRWDSLEEKLPKQPRPMWQNLMMFAGAAIIITSAVVLLTGPKDVIPEIETTENAQIIAEDNSETVNPETSVTPETQESNSSVDNSEPTKSENTIAPQTNTEEQTQTEGIQEPENITRTVETNTTEQETRAEEVPSEIVEQTRSDINADLENSKPEIALLISSNKKQGCSPLTVTFSATANPEDYEFMWHFKDGTRSTEVSPAHTYAKPGNYEPVLILTPKTDGLRRHRIVGSMIRCYGISEPDLDYEKSGNLYTFSSGSTEDVIFSWKVDKEEFNTPQFDYEFKYDGEYTVELKMTESHGCYTELKEVLNVIIEHNYAMPNAFTPDIPGINSTFGPVFDNMENLTFTMMIVDKFNQVIFETDDINRPWDGLNMRTNQEAEGSVYLWKIVTEDAYGNVRTRSGQVTLLRD
jgi:PKD repeat protein